MDTTTKTIINQNDTFSALLVQTEKRGDLPVFNASLNKVRQISSDPDSHAMELAQTIMKDSNLTAKVLRIANSPLFNRGLGRISSLSRAVVLLGFDTIKNVCLTLKLIESFHDDHPTIGMNEMVAKSYLTAGFVRDVAAKCRVKDIEETYIAGLFHNLGDVAVGYYLPEKFNAMLTLHQQGGIPWMQSQTQVLNMSLMEIGQKLASTWCFSNTLINTMRDYNPETEGAVKNRNQLNHAIVSLSSKVVSTLYIEGQGSTQKNLRQQMGDLANATGVKIEHIESSLGDSFKLSCDLAKEYGLDQTVLRPHVSNSGDELRDRLSREFAFYASNQGVISAEANDITPSAINAINQQDCDVSRQQGSSSVNDEQDHRIKTQPLDKEKHQIEQTSSPSQESTPLVEIGNPRLQLSIIQEITTLVTDGGSLNTLFIKILEGIQQGVGFDRSMLCLINPNQGMYSGRMALGVGGDELKTQVSGSININNDIFARVLMEGGDMLVENVQEKSWRNMLPTGYQSNSDVTSFIISGVCNGKKPFGLFYADNHISKACITPNLRRGFMQFIAQARLAIKIRG